MKQTRRRRRIEKRNAKAWFGSYFSDYWIRYFEELEAASWRIAERTYNEKTRLQNAVENGNNDFVGIAIDTERCGD